MAVGVVVKKVRCGMKMLISFLLGLAFAPSALLGFILVNEFIHEMKYRR